MKQLMKIKLFILTLGIILTSGVAKAELQPFQPSTPGDVCGAIDPNMACYAGGNYTECKAYGVKSQACWECGPNEVGKPTCITVQYDARCSCDTPHVAGAGPNITECSKQGWCTFAWF